MAKRGYPDYQRRIPLGWRLVRGDQWPINTTFGPETHFDLKSWRFETYGEVKNPLTMTYGDLLSLPAVTKKLDHHCIDGWSYLGHEWQGVEMSAIIEKIQPASDVAYVLMECETSMSQTFPVDQDLMFAYKRNGKVLPRRTKYS